MTRETIQHPEININLDHTKPMLEIPHGFTCKPPLSYRTAAKAMVELERRRCINLSVGEDFFIDGLEETSVVQFMTNYGFYTDPVGQREMTIILLIANAPLPDYPRLINEAGGTPVMILSRPVNKISLLVVDDTRIDAWIRSLHHSLITHDTIQYEKDLEVYIKDIKGIGKEAGFSLASQAHPSLCQEARKFGSLIEGALLDQDLIVLSSKMYPKFIKVFSKIRWARLIVEEDASCIDLADFPPQAEFYWYIHSNPMEWIKNPLVKERFETRGIIQDEKTFPEIFCVGNSSAFLERCRALPQPSSSFASEEDVLEHILDKSLGKISLDHTWQQYTMARQYVLSVSNIRRDYDVRLEMADEIHRSAQANLALRTASIITTLIKKYPILDFGQEMIVRHCVTDLLKSCTMVSEAFCERCYEHFKKSEHKLFQDLNDATALHRLNSDTARKFYLEKINLMIDNLFQDCTRQVKVDGIIKGIPVYVIERTGTELITTEILTRTQPYLQMGYIQVHGYSKIRTFVAPDQEKHLSGVILGIVHGTRVNVQLVEGVTETVVLICKRVPIRDKILAYNISSVCPRQGKDILTDTSIIDGETSWIISEPSSCLRRVAANKVVVHKLSAGTNMIFC